MVSVMGKKKKANRERVRKRKEESKENMDRHDGAGSLHNSLRTEVRCTCRCSLIINNTNVLAVILGLAAHTKAMFLITNNTNVLPPPLNCSTYTYTRTINTG